MRPLRRLASGAILPAAAVVATLATLSPGVAAAQQYGARAKVPPAVTREPPAGDEYVVRTRRLYLDGLHARLTALLQRYGLTTDGAIRRGDLESGRLRRFVARDSLSLAVTITVMPDPEESSAQLAATRYVLLEAERAGTRVTRDTPDWRQLERMALFLAASQPRAP